MSISGKSGKKSSTKESAIQRVEEGPHKTFEGFKNLRGAAEQDKRRA